MKKTPAELVQLVRLVVVTSTLRLDNSGSINSRPLQQCKILNPSVLSLWTSHIRAFSLWLTLQLYPPTGNGPIVLGFRNRFGNTLLQAEAIVMTSKKTSTLPI